MVNKGKDSEQGIKETLSPDIGIVIGDREDRFRRVINTHSAQNTKLSPKAVGFMFYFLSKSKGWKGQLYDLKKRFRIGDKSVQSGMKELVTEGYAMLKRRPRESGQWRGTYYEIYSIPKKTKKVLSIEKRTDKNIPDKAYLEPWMDGVNKSVYSNN